MHVLKKYILISSFFSALCHSHLSIAAENTGHVDKLIALPIDKLFDVELVSIGSKSEVSIYKTPGIVRAFTQADFQRFGFKTIQDVLQHIPSYQLSPSESGHTNLFIRGVQGRTTSKVLLLLDGVPLQDLFWGNFTIDEMISLRHVARIEVLNGPASVLYGANAFAGIISIITKDSGDSVELSYGQHSSYTDGKQNHHNTSVGINAEFSTKNLYGLAEFYNSEGFNPKLNPQGKIFNRNQNKEKTALFLKYKKKGFSIIGSVNEYQSPYIGTKQNEVRFFHRRPIYLKLGYDYAINENVSLTLQSFINRYRLTRSGDKYKNNYLNRHRDGFRDSTTIGSDATLHIKHKKHNATFGISWLTERADRNHNEMIYFDPDGSVTKTSGFDLLRYNNRRKNLGIFFQDIWDLSPNIALTTGVRYDKLSDFDNEWSYRLGLVGQYDNFYAKLLYGTAFRVPTFREYLKQFNPDLHERPITKPEHLRTLELQLGYLFTKGEVNITLFNNRYRDFIADLLVLTINDIPLNVGDPEEGEEFSVNLAKINTTGIELSSTYYPTQKLSLQFSASALLQAEECFGELPNNNGLNFKFDYDTDVHDISLLSKYMVSILGSYQYSPKTQLGMSILYNSRRQRPDNYQANVPEAERNNNNLSGFLRVNTNIAYQLDRNIQLHLIAKNIFNAKSYSSIIDDPSQYDIEWEGRSIGLYFQINY